MAELYKIAPVHDEALVNLVTITPQPKAQPATPLQRDFGASPSFHEQGLHVCLEWDYIFSEEEYEDLLETYFEFDDQPVTPVTILCRDAYFTMRRYNGYALFPQMGVDVKWENTFISSLKIYIVDLEDLDA